MTEHRVDTANRPREFETADKLREFLRNSRDLQKAVFQDLDLHPFVDQLMECDLRHTVFLGCKIPDEIYQVAGQNDSILFPHVPNTPFRKYRGTLYTPEELQSGYVVGDESSYAETLDGRVFNYYSQTGPDPKDVVEALTRRLHDMSITDAMHEFIEGKKIVSIMGGHSMGRDEPMYGEVAKLARDLTRRGFLVATGGGPGAMEAAHLGAWFARREEGEIDQAVEILARAPLYDPKGPWLDAALEVVERFPVVDRQACQSLGIPTWLYGHEPPARFALTIAKYFANSVREEGLLAIPKGGVVFTPGSAGTIQEIFQDATQNHYDSFGVISPMIFMGQQYWTETKPVYPLLQTLSKGHQYGELLEIHDDRHAIAAALQSFDDSRLKT